MDARIFATEVHKKVISKFDKRAVVSSFIDDIWAIDLLDISKVKTQNSNYTFILCVIDLFSKYAWAIPLKGKSEKVVLDGFKSIRHFPINLWSDEGTEFYNKSFKKFCKDANINLYHTNSGLKSVFVERFNRTLRERINFYTTEYDTNKFIDALDDIVKDYNNTIHSSTGKKPIDIYKHTELPKPLVLSFGGTPKLKVGDFVRIATNLKTFEKKTLFNNWSYDVYKILKIDSSVAPIVYYLENDKGQKIETLFYENELQKTEIPFYKRRII